MDQNRNNRGFQRFPRLHIFFSLCDKILKISLEEMRFIAATFLRKSSAENKQALASTLESIAQ